MRAFLLMFLYLIACSETAKSQGLNHDWRNDQEGIQLYVTGQYESAIRFFEKRLSTDPHDTGAIYMSGLCSFSAGHHKRAIELLSISADSPHFRVISHYYMARIYNELGLTGQAVKEANHAIAYDSSFIPAKLELIRALCGTGRLHEAEKMVDSTSSVDELSLVAKALFDRHDYESAIHYLRLAITLDSLRFENRILLGDSYYELGQTELAFSIYASLFVEYRDLPALFRRLSLCYAHTDKRSDYLTAIDLMKKYIRLTLNISASDLSLIGSWYYKLGEFDSARTYFEWAIASDSSISQVYLNLGLALYQLGDQNGAKAALGKALALSNRYLEHVSFILETLAAVRIKEKKLHRAISTYIRAVEVWPNNLEAIYGLARAYDIAGEKQRSIYQYKKFLLLASKDSSLFRLREAAMSRLRMIEEGKSGRKE
ncbi:MAG: tetratricopeptide repeat protein [Candidatus Kryptoniota bacterium]